MTKVRKKINFGAGPAPLPAEVKDALAASIHSVEDTGLSITEVPHRGPFFRQVLEEANALVRELCGLGQEVEVLWLPGGGRAQFALIPMNFIRGPQDRVAYLDSGAWAAEAYHYASYFGKAEIWASSKDQGYRQLPEIPDETPDFRYIHMTANNTIYGTQYAAYPRVDRPLVADLSSDIFSRERDYQRLDLFYAVAQKFLGVAGVCLLVVKKSFLQTAREDLPPFLSLKKQAEMNSMVNTPPVLAIYTALLYLRWYKAKSLSWCYEGLSRRAGRLYEEIERNSQLISDRRSEDRSRTNLCFQLRAPERQGHFLQWMEERYGIVGIEGHRSVGGLRVSLYHGIDDGDLDLLVQALQEYEHVSH